MSTEPTKPELFEVEYRAGDLYTREGNVGWWRSYRDPSQVQFFDRKDVPGILERLQRNGRTVRLFRVTREEVKIQDFFGSPRPTESVELPQ